MTRDNEKPVRWISGLGLESEVLGQYEVEANTASSPSQHLPDDLIQDLVWLCARIYVHMAACNHHKVLENPKTCKIGCEATRPQSHLGRRAKLMVQRMQVGEFRLANSEHRCPRVRPAALCHPHQSNVR